MGQFFIADLTLVVTENYRISLMNRCISFELPDRFDSLDLFR